MKTANRLSWIWFSLILLSGACYSLSLLLEAVWVRACAETIYDHRGNQLSFSGPLTAELILRALTRLKITDFTPVSTPTMIAPVASISLGAIVLLLTWHKPKSWLRCGFFLSQGFLSYSGWVGIFFAFCTLLSMATPLKVGSLDGEWLADGFPTAIAQGVWVVVSLIIAAKSLPVKLFVPSLNFRVGERSGG
jgi:hypothetical protein